MVSVRALEAFRAVMTSGTVSAAAELMHVSQPAVSRLIRDLEIDIGFPLFDRAQGRLTATPDALEFLAEVDKAFIGLDQIRRSAEQIRSGHRSHLTIASMPAMAQSVVPDVLAELAGAAPEISVNLTAARTPNVVRAVASRQAQLGIVALTAATPGVQVVERLAVSYRCILPPGHRLGERDVIRLQDLKGELLVNFASNTSTGTLIARLMQSGTLQVKARFEAHLSAIVSALVLRGLGFSIVDRFTAESHARSGGIVRPIALSESLNLQIIVPEATRMRPFQQAFVERLIAHCAERKG